MKRSGFKGLVAVGLVAAGISSSTSVVSASDMFLKLSGIKGESQDAKHKDEIDVLSWAWGMSNGTAKVRKGAVAPQCIQDLELTKFVDASSPQLIMLGVLGQTAKEGTLTVRKSGDKQQEYLTFTMTDVMVTSYQTGGSAESNAPLVDQVVLHFSSIVGEYRPQNADGSVGNAVVFQIATDCKER
jgi:type VI secretion system secreted protein Hcp